MASGDSYDVFLSYARSDEAGVAELSGWLSAQGFCTFFDRNALRPGMPWISALEEAIGRSRAVAILVGPHGIGNFQQYERELALVRQAQDHTFPVIPVLMPGCDSAPTGFLQLMTWVDFSKDGNVLQQTERLEKLRAALRGEKVAASLVRASICPYRGLEPFHEEDAAFFCGRDDAIRELVSRVQEHEFVAVVGPSGSGKSSLVFAGLLPALRKQGRTTMWDAVTVRPGKRPLHALAEAFGTAAANAGPAAIDAWLEAETAAYRAGDAETLARIVDRRLDAAAENPDRLLIYVDQWEELYAMAPSPEDQVRLKQHSDDVERFIQLLVTAASGPGSRASVVLTVRADFYNPLIRNPLLAALLPKQQVNIPPMNRDDLRSAIETPAKTAGLSFAPPELVDRILDDVGLEEGRLPLLQFALKETWQERKGERLTAEAYTAVGGVARAIEKTAEDAYERLTPAQKDAARRLFLRLVTPGEGQADTRARSVMPDDPEQFDIVNRFSNPKTRLLVTALQATGPGGGEVRATVEVAHEALIQRWPTLRDWVRANRENMRARAAILRFRAEWEEHGQDEKFLLDPGVQLERGRALLANPGDVAVDDIRGYIARSIDKEQRRLEAEREAALADQKRIADARKRTARVAFAGLVVALFVAGLAIWQYLVATAAKEDAVAAAKEAKAQTAIAENARRQTDRQKVLAESAIEVGQQIAGPISERLSRPAEVAKGAVDTTSPIAQAAAYLEFANYYLHSFDVERAKKQIDFATKLMDMPPNLVDNDQKSQEALNLAANHTMDTSANQKYELDRLRITRDELLGDCNSKDTRNFHLAHKAYTLAISGIERLVSDALHLNVDKDRILIKDANVYLLDNRLDRADQLLSPSEEDLSKHLDETNVPIELGKLNHMRAEIAIKRGQTGSAEMYFDASEKFFRQAMARDPADNQIALDLAQMLTRRGDFFRRKHSQTASSFYETAFQLYHNVLASDPTSQQAVVGLEYVRIGERRMGIVADAEREEERANRAIAQEIDSVFGKGVGEFHFGMTPEEVNALLEHPFPSVSDLSPDLPDGAEYAGNRYFYKYLRGEPKLSLSEFVEPCIFNKSFVVFLFSEGQLFKIGYHSLPPGEACSRRDSLVDRFSSRFGLVATGSSSDRRFAYQGKNVGISAKTTSYSISLEFIQR